MELINPNTLVNNRVNDDYYCKRLLDNLSKKVHTLIGDLSLGDNRISFNREYFTVGFLIDYDKPVNRDSLKKSLDNALNVDYDGCMSVRNVTISSEPRDTLRVEVNITNPYKFLYDRFHKEFKGELVKFFNSNIEYYAVNTDDKFFDFDIVYMYPSGLDIPLEYLDKVLMEIVEEKPIYSFRHRGRRDKSNTIGRISWGDGEVKAETKSSYMDGIKTFLLKLLKVSSLTCKR